MLKHQPMQQLLSAFLLGNGAILTNVCLLPLYPGLIAFLAGNAGTDAGKRSSGWLGVLVLAGILSMMTVVALLLYLLKQSFSSILPWLLPFIYGVVFLFGILMLFGYNPFNRLTTMQAPLFKNPYASAYMYGLFLGPITLPCTGPIILSAFLLSGNTTLFINQIFYFLAFGLGFGWPLVVLPLMATPLQRRSTKWLTQNHKTLTRISGVLLMGIGVYGFVKEILPKLT
ncbi:MAG: cytochrome c biogenesis CcdA family protein [Trueperaceae bacterium]